MSVGNFGLGSRHRNDINIKHKKKKIKIGATNFGVQIFKIPRFVI